LVAQIFWGLWLFPFGICVVRSRFIPRITVIVVRIAWVMTHNSFARWRIRRVGFRPPRPTSPPTLGSGLVISWAGMRGIVSLAAALALPVAFPHRGLIVLTAFAVVVGTLVVQGLTLKPLIKALHFAEDDPVAREVESARQRALDAALAALDGESSPAVQVIRRVLGARLGGLASATPVPAGAEAPASWQELELRAIRAARLVTFEMRSRDDIGDDAFHRLEEEFDRIEVSVTRAGQS
jgi:NhaP-type Na+/H+ or K+/H+ antiporter